MLALFYTHDGSNNILLFELFISITIDTLHIEAVGGKHLIWSPTMVAIIYIPFTIW